MEPLDGHSSHISLPLIDLAKNIILFKLIAHSSYVLQPLDVSVFGLAKAKWKSEIDNYFRANGLIDIGISQL